MKYLGYIFKGCVVILTFLILIIFLGLGVERPQELVYYFWGEYPAQGEYRVVFKEDDDSCFARVYYKQDICEFEKMDTNNLKIYPELINLNYYYDIDKENIYDDVKYREILLLKGLAKIIDESKATAEEIDAQSEAKEQESGCWSKKTKDTPVVEGQSNTEFSVLKMINWLKNYYKSIVYLLFRCVASVMGITFIISLLIKFSRRNNVDIIFWGEIASGKTTIMSRLKNFNVTKTELLKITSTKGQSVLKGERIAIGKKDIYLYLVDNAGQDYAKMFDRVNKGRFSNPYQVIIVPIALNQDGSKTDDAADTKFIGSEISKAVQIIEVISGSRKLKSNKRLIILFINKCDVLYKDEQEMFNDEHKIVDSYLEKAFDYTMLLELEDRYAEIMHRVYGSALEGWGMYEIRKIIEEI